MTVRVFIHSNSKRAETISLLNSGATENFLNLDYAKWLKLPIKRLPFPRKLFNVNGMENNAAKARFMPRTVNKPRPAPIECILLCKATIGTAQEIDNTKIPPEYAKHSKVFSEEQSQ